MITFPTRWWTIYMNSLSVYSTIKCSDWLSCHDSSAHWFGRPHHVPYTEYCYKWFICYTVSSLLHFSHDIHSDSQFNYQSRFWPSSVKIYPYPSAILYPTSWLYLSALILKFIHHNYILKLVHTGSSLVTVTCQQLWVIQCCSFHWLSIWEC